MRGGIDAAFAPAADAGRGGAGLRAREPGAARQLPDRRQPAARAGVLAGNCRACLLRRGKRRGKRRKALRLA